MAEALKTKGLQELSQFRKRVNRQYALGRISRPDRQTLIGLVDELEAVVIKITEKPYDTEDYT